MGISSLCDKGADPPILQEDSGVCVVKWGFWGHVAHQEPRRRSPAPRRALAAEARLKPCAGLLRAGAMHLP